MILCLHHAVIQTTNKCIFRLITKATGYPKPTIKWHVDNIPVEVTENVALETYEDGTSVLNIPHAVLDDCGEYTCEALNRNGVDTTVTTVVVLQGMLIPWQLSQLIKEPA